MPTSRRTFIRNTTIAAAGAGLFSNGWFRTKEKLLTGIQLYSVRDAIKKDPLGVLRQIAEMGYKHVEHANYIDRKFYGYPAKEFKKVLDDLDLKMPSGHTVLRKEHWNAGKGHFEDSWLHTIDDAAALGQQYVISPSLDGALRKDKEALLRFMEVFNKSGERCRKSGMKFGYHNHDFEFKEKFGDESLYDIILKNTDPELVMQQLDIGNMYNGGAKAIDVLNRWPGRFPSMHVKDEIKAASGNEAYESCVLAKGVIPVKEVIDLGRKSGGTLHFIIEQEAYQGKDPIESVREDLRVMKGWGY